MKNTEAERRNLTMPPDWWAAFEESAKGSGMTLSAWIALAGKKQLPASARKALSVPRKPGRQPKAGK